MTRMTEHGTSDSQHLNRMMFEHMLKQKSSAIPAISLTVSILALVVAGATGAYVALGQGLGSAAVSPSLPQAAAPAAPAVATTAQAAPTPQSAAPAAGAPANANTRIAQSSNGSIYAFDPNTSLSFIFDANRAGPTPISQEEIPADIRDQLVNGTGAPQAGQAGGVVNSAALEAQTARAREALTAQQRYETRPPLNDSLSDPAIAGEIVGALDQAQGIIRPGPEGSGEPVIYVFFDPQCPYCHRAFAALDGKFAIKWLPVSTLGPAGDKLHAYIMNDVALNDVTLENGQSGQEARFSEDSARPDRLAEVMTDQVEPPEAALSDAHSFVLGENGELFRILSRGAEDMRAVPTFFIREPDGSATWLRGFDTNTGSEIADIVAGRSGG